MNMNEIVGMLVGFTGFVIVGINGYWWIAIGVFLMLFGNNLERSGRKL